MNPWSRYLASQKLSSILVTLVLIGLFQPVRATDPLGDPTLLRTIYRTYDNPASTTPGDPGYNSMRSGTEDNRVAPPAPGSPPQTYDYGPYAYISYAPLPGTTAFNRYTTGSLFRDSASSPGTGYTLDQALGFAWNSMNAADKVDLTCRASSSPGAHYITTNANQGVVGGYTNFTEDLGYGYPRYGTADTSMMTRDTGTVKLEFDRVCGGALWQITYTHPTLGPKLLINDCLYGRQVCTFYDFYTSFTGTPDGLQHLIRQIPSDCGMSVNPPPAGSGEVSWLDTENARLGAVAPVWETNSTNGGDIETIPVENSSTAWQTLQKEYFNMAVNPRVPILYPDFRIRKEFQIGVRDSSGSLISGLEQTVKWKVKWKMASTANIAVDGAPTLPQFGIAGLHYIYDMQYLYLYDPNDGPMALHTDLSGVGTDCTAWINNTINRQFKRAYSTDSMQLAAHPDQYIRNYTAVICSTTDKNYAIGVVGRLPDPTDNFNPAKHGSVNYFLGFNWHLLQPLTTASGTSSATDNRATGVDAENGENRTVVMTAFSTTPVTTGGFDDSNANYYVVYFVIGTVQECEAQVDALYAHKDTLEW